MYVFEPSISQGRPNVYIKVKWFHDFPSEPVELYSEIDDGEWENRKVEIYRDGHADWASKDASRGTSMLSETKFPSLEEIAQQSEFSPCEITYEEFSNVWSTALNETFE